MKIPGRLWLQFEVDSTEQQAVIRQTTVFDPSGYVGLAYWYLLYPVHSHVFRRMLRGIQRTIQPDFPGAGAGAPSHASSRRPSTVKARSAGKVLRGCASIYYRR